MPRLLAVQPDDALLPLIEELRRRGFAVDDRDETGSCQYDVVLVSSAGVPPPSPRGDGPIRIFSGWIRGDAVDWAARIALMASERARRRLFSRVLETSPDLEAWISPGGDCEYVSPSCEDLSGHPPDAYLADAALFVRCGHPEDQDRLRASIFGPGTIAQTFCCRIITRAGDVRRVVHQTIPCQDERGRPIGVRVHQHRAPDEDPSQEVQRLRALLGQTEGDRALLTAVIESLPVGVIAMGGAGELLVANPAAVPYLEQVRGAPLPAEAYLGHYRELERQLHGPDGQPQYLHLTAGPLARTGHRIFGAVGAIQDITHARISAQARRRELAEAKQQVWRLEGANTDLALRLESLEERLEEMARHASLPPVPAGGARPPEEAVPEAVPLDVAAAPAVLAAIPDQVWVLDTELRCRYVNPAGAAAARRRATRLVGQPWAGVRLASGLVREIARKAPAVLREGTERTGIWTDDVEGSPQIYHYALRRAVLEDGAPSVIATIRDGSPLRRHVRQRSRATAHQEHLQAVLRAILDQMPVGVVLAEAPSGRVLFRNPGFVEIWGEHVPSPARLDEYDVWAGARRDETPYGMYDWPLARAAATGEVVRDEEIRIACADGATRVYSVSAGPIRDERGTAYAAAATFIEVTDRHAAEDAVLASEQRLRLAARAIPQVIAIYDLAGRYVFVNEVGAAFLGRNPGEMVGCTDQEIFGLRGTPGWTRFALETIATRAASGGEVRATGPGGEERIIVASCMPLLQADGGCNEVLLVGLDTTAERRAAAELEDYASELARSNDELQQFAYVASHDLQEPLRSIVSFVELLERRYRGRLDDDADEMIDFIVEGGLRMQDLIRDLLAFSRIATRGGQFAPFSLDDVLRDALLDLRCIIAEGGAVVRYRGLPTVWGDRGQMVQVFEHLISNAVKFRRPDQRPEVTVSAVRDRRMWHVMVADNGIGIESEYFDRIFGVFQRLHTKDSYAGTGIGLAIVKKIAERHGGRVWVDSVYGEGSVFHITLPVVPQDEPIQVAGSPDDAELPASP